MEKYGLGGSNSHWWGEVVHDGVKLGTYLDPAPGSPWQFSGLKVFRTHLELLS